MLDRKVQPIQRVICRTFSNLIEETRHCLFLLVAWWQDFAITRVQLEKRFDWLQVTNKRRKTKSPYYRPRVFCGIEKVYTLVELCCTCLLGLKQCVDMQKRRVIRRPNPSIQNNKALSTQASPMLLFDSLPHHHFRLKETLPIQSWYNVSRLLFQTFVCRFSLWRINRPVGASSSVIIVVRFFFRLLSSSSLRFLSRFLQPYSFPQNGGMFNWSYVYLSRLCGCSIQDW